MKKWVALLLLRGTQRDLQSAAPPPRTAPRGPVLRVLAFFIAGQHSGGAWGGYLLDSWLACSYGDRVAPGLTMGLGRTPWRWLLGWRRGGSFPGSRVAGVPWRRVLVSMRGLFSVILGGCWPPSLYVAVVDGASRQFQRGEISNATAGRCHRSLS